jgi:conjugal transfer pilus assembly protein TraV
MSRGATIALLLTTALGASGCTTLGGTVKGDFTCRAPAGTCAPMTKIDAAAIGSVDEEGASAPTVGPRRQGARGNGGSVAVRTGERMLTILLPAHVDEAGVLHDAATVHAVVEQPAWTFASVAEPTSIPEFSRSPAPSSLREAVAGASAPVIEGLESPPAQAPQPFSATASTARIPDPAAPSAAAIAAARAGHRIGTKPPATVPAPAGKRLVPNTSTLPAGKVVLPQGDPAAARARLNALAAPNLSRFGTTLRPVGPVTPEMEGSPFSTPVGQEQPR